MSWYDTLEAYKEAIEAMRIEYERRKREQFTGGGKVFVDLADAFHSMPRPEPKKKPLNLSNWKFRTVLDISDIALYVETTSSSGKNSFYTMDRTYFIGTVSKTFEPVQLPDNIMELAGVEKMYFTGKLVKNQDLVNAIINYAIDNGLYYHPIEELI